MKYNEPVLNEREHTHGDFVANANLAQALKAGIRAYAVSKLDRDHQEALDLICTKMARICVGNPYEADHWNDIAGYAKLIYERLTKQDQLSIPETIKLYPSLTGPNKVSLK